MATAAAKSKLHKIIDIRHYFVPIFIHIFTCIHLYFIKSLSIEHKKALVETRAGNDCLLKNLSTAQSKYTAIF